MKRATVGTMSDPANERWSGVARAATEPVAQRVFHELKSAIVAMGLLPGRALSESEIAAQMGVSRQPVREAFIKLSEAGLVQIRPQRGTFVVKISTKQVTEARFVREAVEVAVAQRACEAMSTETIAALRDIIAQQQAVASEGSPARFLALDEAFHRGLALGVDCDYAWRVVEEIKAQMDRVRYLSMPQTTPLTRLVEQHAAILDAVEARDAARAEKAMRAHLAEILKSLPLIERTYPHLFDSEESDDPTPPFTSEPARF